MRANVPKQPPVLVSQKQFEIFKNPVVIFAIGMIVCFIGGLFCGLFIGKTQIIENQAANQHKSVHQNTPRSSKGPEIFSNRMITGDLPVTKRPAHIDDEFSKWQIPESTQKQLYAALQSAPVNPKTGRHCLMFSVTNEGMIGFTTNMYCSMQLAGIPYHNHVMIALDVTSYKAMKSIGAQVIYLKSNFTLIAVNNNRIVDFNDICKIRPTILHQILLWNGEAILVDIDVVFLQNPLPLFTDEADFEVQCDSKEYVRVPSHIHPVVWQANLGFFKVHPTPVVMEMIVHWFTRMYRAAKMNDQLALRKVLKKMPTRWLNDDTLTLEMKRLLERDEPELATLTFRFLDPMYICNAGGLYQDNMTLWIEEAHRREIKRPWLIHYFHIGSVGGKLETMKKTDMWFVDKNFMCAKQQTVECREWSLWNKPLENARVAHHE